MFNYVKTLNDRNKLTYNNKNSKTPHVYLGSYKIEYTPIDGFYIINRRIKDGRTYIGFDFNNLISWYEMHPRCFLSNISFVKEYINRFKTISLYIDEVTQLQKILLNIDIIEFRVFFGTKESISKFVLQGFKLCYNLGNCLFLLKKASVVYLVSILTIVCLDKKFPFKTCIPRCKILYIENWSVGTQTNISEYFSYLPQLETICLKEFCAKEVVQMTGICFGDFSLKLLDLSGMFIEYNLIQGTRMFDTCDNLEKIITINKLEELIRVNVEQLTKYKEKKIEIESV